MGSAISWQRKLPSDGASGEVSQRPPVDAASVRRKKKLIKKVLHPPRLDFHVGVRGHDTEAALTDAEPREKRVALSRSLTFTSVAIQVSFPDKAARKVGAKPWLASRDRASEEGGKGDRSRPGPTCARPRSDRRAKPSYERACSAHESHPELRPRFHLEE